MTRIHRRRGSTRPLTFRRIGNPCTSVNQPKAVANRISRQSVTFLSTAADALLTRFQVEPGGARDPRHIHPWQMETITVLEGRIRRNLPDRSEDVLEQGQTWEIARGVPHTWEAIEGPVILQIDFQPALRTRALITRLFSLAEAGKTNSKGMPNPLQIAVIALEYASELRLASPPWPVQQMVLAAVAPFARLLGYRP